MAVTAGDIDFFLSIKTGSAGNSLAQGDVNASLGKYISTTEISGTPANNLFDDITGARNAASEVDYRCIFVKNVSATTLQNAAIYLSAETSGGASIAIAIDDVTAVAHDSASAQADEIANDTTAPTSVGSFSSPTTSGGALSIGSLAQNECRAVWVRRTAADSAAKDTDGVTFTVIGDTGE